MLLKNLKKFQKKCNFAKMIIDKRGTGEYFLNAFYPIGTLKAMYYNLLEWKNEYMGRHIHIKKFPEETKRYIKQIDDKLSIYEKILSKYDRSIGGAEREIEEAKEPNKEEKDGKITTKRGRKPGTNKTKSEQIP